MQKAMFYWFNKTRLKLGFLVNLPGECKIDKISYKLQLSSRTQKISTLHILVVNSTNNFSLGVLFKTTLFSKSLIHVL